MAFSTYLLNLLSARRLAAIDDFRKNPAAAQRKQLGRLMPRLAAVAYGRERNIRPDDGYETFAAKIPVATYDDLKPYIDRMRREEPGVLWDERVEWFAKSSGTTADVSKYIPVPRESLMQCHYRGARDVISVYLHNYPGSHLFTGKTLTLGGSHAVDALSGTSLRSGDLSAILIQHTPFYAAAYRTPSKATALTADFEKKVAAICRETAGQRVTSFAGVPSWNMVLLKALLEYTGKRNVCEVWPDLELFMHGGVSFAPYREQYRRLIPSDGMHYMETYNASEGFFALQDDPADEAMLLMLDYGVFYEFLDMKYLDDPSKAVPLEAVQRGVNYAVIISTNGGLWRYMIGDTVRFTSLAPHKIVITGRTKHYINVFGEEVIIDNAQQALDEACRATGASVTDYTVAPVYMDENARGAHQWIIEFGQEPGDRVLFETTLDETLQRVNSDYRAKRAPGSSLMPARITYAPQGTFYRWMKERGKLGGQNKIPRLSNDRKYADQLMELLGKNDA